LSTTLSTKSSASCSEENFHVRANSPLPVTLNSPFGEEAWASSAPASTPGVENSRPAPALAFSVI
jgi:hypothetical protein